jgi:streptogramin lyase
MEPDYQQLGKINPALTTVQMTGERTIPDVSFAASRVTSTGIANVVAVYYKYRDLLGRSAGGTSVGVPVWAGLFALVNQGRANKLDNNNPTEALTALYAAPPSFFTKVLSGKNDGINHTGFAMLNNPQNYNEVTGLGSPKANLLVPWLIKFDMQMIRQDPILPTGTVGLPYYVPITADGGIGPVSLTYNIDSGTLPPGLGFTVATGELDITGTPTASGSVSFDVTATDSNGNSVTDTYSFTIDPAAAPTVTAISPAAGPVAGDSTVTITGANLAGATAVDFGANAGGIVSDSDTQMIVTSPAGTAGTVDVTIVTAGGASATSAADQFSYANVPTVTGISQAAGFTGGGTMVTIVGTNLAGATAVDFGVNAATIVSVSDTQIVAITPPSSVGVVDVEVVTPGGTSATSSADRFSYLAVTSFPIPTLGSGAHAIIRGADGNLWFTESNVNQIGEINAMTGTVTEFPVPTPNSGPTIIALGPDGNFWFTESNANQIGEIDATTHAFSEFPIPTAGSGPHGITVGPDGNLWFTESKVNKIGEISVATHAISEFLVPTADSRPWNITIARDGTLWFTEFNTNKLGQIDTRTHAVKEFSVPTQPGSGVDAIVLGPDGSLWFTEVNVGGIGEIDPLTDTISQFTVPTPMSGPAGIVSGPDGNVWFAELLANQVAEINPATHAIREVPVPTPNSGPLGIATGPGGNLWFTESNANQIGEIAASSIVAPAVTSITPASGPVAGGTSVTIAGTHLLNATAVYFGSTAATILSDSDAQIVVTSPPGTQGSVNVTLRSPGGTGASSAGDGFSYIAAPIVTGVSPGAGAGGDSTSVTIIGTNLANATAVHFGTTAVTSFISNTATQIVLISPAGTAETVDITVTAASGTSAISPADEFTYAAAPVVTGIGPVPGGPVAGGTWVLITGTNLAAATAVDFGSAAGSIVSASDTQLVAISPAGTPGPVDVTVVTAGGTSATSPADRFGYVAGPSVTGISPATGSLAGGTAVTIMGSDLANAVAVEFGANAVTSFISDTPTQIVVIVPAGMTGTVDVIVVTPGGTSAASSADLFSFVRLATNAIVASDRPSGSVYGQTVTFTATVSAASSGTGTPTGTVQFQIDGANFGDPVSLTTGTASFKALGLAAGNHAVTALYSGDDTFVGGNVALSGGQTVTPAPLTITANDLSMVSGGTLPTLTASYSGLVNGDTPSSLTTLPVLNTTAGMSTPPGTYLITVGGAVDPNYTITYVSGTLTVTPGTTPPQPTDPRTAFVAALYRDVLGRAPEAGGVTLWVQALQGGATQAQVVQAVWESAEHRGLEVDQFYATYLHRAADALGRTFWIDQLLGGASETDVAAQFLASEEYTLEHPDTASFVQGVYGDALGRTPDAVGLAAWPPLADQTVGGRLATARGVLTSVEADLHLLNGFYALYLHRDADAGSQQDWVAAIQSGQVTPGQVAEAVLASDEYFRRVSAAM